MSTVYFISGLGADERMFQFLHIKCKNKVYVRWIQPHEDEPLHDYAVRLAEQITEPNPVLVGMSFGGVVAIELSKFLNPRKTILISSIASSKILPWYYRLMGFLRLHRVIPVSWLKRFHFVGPMLFGASTKAEKVLLKQVILETDPTFLRWAIGQLLNWHQPDHYENCVMIHGTADRILPMGTYPGIIKVKRAGHLMVLSHASEISAILDKILEDCET
ncbi:alpha/beta hydrolase [Pontibacter indicus]|uniref:Alpha/beta hydrolase family protein n=1 Tax=Pontibacter indicus TaxID=1317125 RepID=A0A1R3XPK3_9BACT|nr:alpha/beta hydrolase [Pontibacter indicus]SIT93870.1 Alpha/beta hydrolase family protein [Pontibacter indicus]